jgi:hypothetical protein
MTREEVQDEAYENLKALDVQKINQHNLELIKRDNIGKLLGSTSYFTDKSWPFMVGPTGLVYSVSRFYLRLNTAVDIFDTFQGHETEIEFKRKAFKEHGVRYGALDYSMKPSDLIPQVGIPVLK